MRGRRYWRHQPQSFSHANVIAVERRSLMRLLTLVAVFCLAGLPSLAQSQTQLRLGHPQAETSAFQAGAQALAADLERRTHGRYKVQIFPAGALGGERELIASAQNGSLDLVLTSTGPVGLFVPDTLLTDITLPFRDYDPALKAHDGPVGRQPAGPRALHQTQRDRRREGRRGPHPHRTARCGQRHDHRERRFLRPGSSRQRQVDCWASSTNRRRWHQTLKSRTRDVLPTC